MATTTLKIDPETKERIQRLAKTRHRSSHWMMLDAISQYLDREEKRETLRKDAEHAWQEYRETGLHVTSDEVVSWLDSWGETHEHAAPKCHK